MLMIAIHRCVRECLKTDHIDLRRPSNSAFMTKARMCGSASEYVPERQACINL